jgi:hypothetical protein
MMQQAGVILMEEHDHKRCAPHISKKISKPIIKSLGIKQSRKSSYTIFEGLSDERCGEHVKAKKMPFYPKQNPLLDENCQQKGGGQLQPMDEDGEGS